MQSENEYIGDDKFRRFLEHFSCKVPLEVVKLRFAGAICSPNGNLRPTDVISSLFEDNKPPRLTTKGEAELFFKFFMGLWDEMFGLIKYNNLKLPPIQNSDYKDLAILCKKRAEQIESGFVEGFWGGCDKLEIPNYAAELINSLSELGEAYAVLAQKQAQTDKLKDILPVIEHTDETANKTLSFIIENLVLPHIAKLQRNIN